MKKKFKFSQNFLSKAQLKNFLIGNRYKIIYGQVSAIGSACHGFGTFPVRNPGSASDYTEIQFF